ncbi:PLC-like phosphodiesterase [Polychytrium aggregatum]|uniref:PLC-like phosphodiesterase n=1 Tax=Polychytrium aggregatum TaxID=110093 RepID=UPI0022FDF571|nr:PLC-like phosphodiesterase [Polychytrium aggregatum]XP_052970474.1 PLC-like phosphodiesterase [Polychytrium aggregatum]KAI9188460.1 PLC-like phosphodiesterase [Polychytrium aggregatum]KAI9208394.1 PLC-like phosphodiesterase [Polychytrium aggregatum]
MKLILSAAAAALVAATSVSAWVVSGPQVGAEGKVWPIPSKCWKTLDGKPTLNVCHRGSRFHLPEESAGAYWESVLQNCDYTEPDITFSKDGVAMANHDLFLNPGLDISDPFFTGKDRSRWVTKEDQYQQINASYWVSDFTAKEIKDHAFIIQNAAMTYRPKFYNHLFPMLTIEEYYQTVMNVSALTNTMTGLIPEIKSSFYHNTQVLNKTDLSAINYFDNAVPGGKWPSNYEFRAEESTIATLKKLGLPTKNHPVIIQCFEWATIEYLARTYPNQSMFRGLLFLVDANWWALTNKGLDAVAAVAKETGNQIYVGPWKDATYDGEPLYILQSYNINIYDESRTALVYPGYDPRDIIEPASLVAAIHQRGLYYYPYTYYDSRQSLSYSCMSSIPKDFDMNSLHYKPVPCPQNKRDEFFQHYAMGTDAMFIENQAEANQLRDEYNTILLLKCRENYLKNAASDNFNWPPGPSNHTHKCRA